ncbi:MAG: S9 family peptidase [Chloroflexi bacterium]|nr:S9 family peptidase [Chloroflexota bacterium]
MPPLRPETLVYDLTSASDPQVSPDGTRLAYVVGRSDSENDRGTSQIWLSGIDGSDAGPITSSGSRNTDPRWSPDGRWLAFVSDRGAGGNAIMLLPIGTPGEARELTRHQPRPGQLAWSPDAAQLAYVAAFDPDNPEEQAQPDGRPTRVRVTRRLDYKQDGQGFLNDVRGQVFVVDVQRGERRMLTRETHDLSYPAWSPDGQVLAAKVATHNGIYSQVALIQAATGALQRFGPAQGTVAVWSWSPNGDRIVFAGDTAPTAQTDFFILDPISGQTQRLTTDLQCLPEGGFPGLLPPSQPVWLDDRSILFHAVHGGESGFYRFDVDRADVQREYAAGALNTGYSIDARHRYVAQAHSSLRLIGEVAVHDRDSGQTEIVSRFNVDLLDANPPAQWERFDVERNGVTTQAWLLKPPDFDADRRYPVILDVHGGPHGYYGFGFNAIQQTLATHGFLVVYSNPRGSGSYGREFAQMVRCDWGGEDYLDLMAVVDAVLERPYADPERTGIWGYSYGGFMTAWTISHTDRFKAAVCGAPCFDLESMYGTSDISHEWGLYQWGGKPHEASEAFAAHSPSTFAHRTRTPTLIVHGEADERCPIGQGEQMFVALHQAGCEVEFARYPGQFHGMLRVGPPSHRADLIGRMLAWFTDHLGRAE